MQDSQVLPVVFDVACQIMALQAQAWKDVEENILPASIPVVVCPAIHGPALDGLLRLYSTYVSKADSASTRSLVTRLCGSVDTNGKVPTSATTATQSYANVAKAVGIVLAQSPETFTAVAGDLLLPIKVGLVFPVFVIHFGHLVYSLIELFCDTEQNIFNS